MTKRRYKCDKRTGFVMEWANWFSQRKMSISLLLSSLCLALVSLDSLHVLLTGNASTYDVVVSIGLLTVLLMVFATIALETRQTATS